MRPLHKNFTERKSQMKELQKKIGYTFKNEKLLEEALTHSSFTNGKHLKSNERLEFLGDSVLSIVVSKYLFENLKNMPEGQLTKIRAGVVCENALYPFARKIDLGKYIFLGKGEKMTGGRDRHSILADAFEALLAAIYLDAGAEDGMQSVAKFLLPLVKSAMDALPEVGDVRIDSKSRLQEFIQQDREQKEVLEYRLTGESGPDHNKTFTVDLYLGANCIGSGKGHSKKAAEQAAAKAALSLFGLI